MKGRLSGIYFIDRQRCDLMVKSRLRLPRANGSIKRIMRRRRLDLVTLRKEIFNDIMQFAQSYHADVINEEFGEWGDSLEETLQGCSLRELLRIHKWMGLSEGNDRDKEIKIEPSEPVKQE